jgi:hypothetical protein
MFSTGIDRNDGRQCDMSNSQVPANLYILNRVDVLESYFVEHLAVTISYSILAECCRFVWINIYGTICIVLQILINICRICASLIVSDNIPDSLNIRLNISFRFNFIPEDEQLILLRRRKTSVFITCFLKPQKS